MGEVVELGDAQQKRSELRRAMVEQAAMHPALRWLVAGDDSRAHRRRQGGDTACGLEGPLVLADTGADYCAVCYPYWASVRA